MNKILQLESFFRAAVLHILVLLCRRYASKEKRPVSADSRLMSCLKQAIGFIQAEHDRDLSLEETANQVGLSKFYFEREFRKVTGYSFVFYVNTVRCERAKALLSQSEQKTGVIGKVCGFSNPSYFISVFKKNTGFTPAEYRLNQREGQL